MVADDTQGYTYGGWIRCDGLLVKETSPQVKATTRSPPLQFTPGEDRGDTQGCRGVPMVADDTQGYRGVPMVAGLDAMASWLKKHRHR